VLYFVEEQRVGYNSVVFKEGDPVRYIYVLFQGEFKLYKKVVCKKQARPGGGEESEQMEARQARHPHRNVGWKGLQVGEILGHLELLHSQGAHLESCVCKSQEGVVLRVERGKFLKKVLGSEHNLEELLQFAKSRYQAKLGEL
jgi:CRP-like cAMP-binding protein